MDQVIEDTSLDVILPFLSDPSTILDEGHLVTHLDSLSFTMSGSGFFLNCHGNTKCIRLIGRVLNVIDWPTDNTVGPNNLLVLFVRHMICS